VEFRFKSDKLRLLYTQEEGAHRYPAAVVKGFFHVMSIIRSMPNEGDLYYFKSLHYEKLKGTRGKLGERSLRLNDQWRLIIKLETDPRGKTILVLEIGDHYK
jgi:proteic killer suppression protein